MQKERYDNLVRTMYVQSSSYRVERMNKFIIEQLEQIEGVSYYVDDDSIYVTKGEAESYPCQVAHTDTVHTIINNFVVFQHNDKLFSIDGDSMERVGIGGDDKVGIFVALQMLREVNVMKAAFFRDEEVGCVGSKRADMKFFDDVEFALQCDRKGYKDFVNEIWGTQLYSTEFSWAIQEILNKFGRKETSGGLTDVCQLAENGLDVCVANMSCGYYSPHSDNEYIVISEVNETLNFCIEMFAALSGFKWEIKREAKTYGGMYGGLGWGTSYGQRVADARNFNSWGDSHNRLDIPNSDEISDEDVWGTKANQEKNGIVFPEYCYCCGGTDLEYDDSEMEMWCFECDDYVFADRKEAARQIARRYNLDIDIDAIDDDTNLEDIPKKYTTDWDEIIEENTFIKADEKDGESESDIGGKTPIKILHLKPNNKSKK